MPATSVPFSPAQGITFVHNGNTYTATSISVSSGRKEFDVSSTDLAIGDIRRFRYAALNFLEIKVDWLGYVAPSMRVTSNFTITGSDMGAADYSGKPALCTGLSYSGSPGEILKGSATFKVSDT